VGNAMIRMTTGIVTLISAGAAHEAVGLLLVGLDVRSQGRLAERLTPLRQVILGVGQCGRQIDSARRLPATGVNQICQSSAAA
jgi:hypothetical protein